MSTVPVEFERACERRWIAKFSQPVPAAPLCELEDIVKKEPVSQAVLGPRQPANRNSGKLPSGKPGGIDVWRGGNAPESRGNIRVRA
jgi:hypothetical protein